MKKQLVTVGIIVLLVTIGFSGCEKNVENEKQKSETGNNFVVTSIADAGNGTLRQAIINAQSGDTITFDPNIFLPSAPQTIFINGTLPPITQNDLTIDGSNAGVLLNGSMITGEEFVSCLEIHSHRNTVKGLQIVDFVPGAGIYIGMGAQNNTIDANVVNHCDIGIALGDNCTSFNHIIGNIVGTDTSGENDLGNTGSGIWIFEGASYNTIGPDNIIAFNKAYGVEIRDIGTTITQNSIHDNAGGGIYMWRDMGSNLSAPVIFDFDISEGFVSGNAPPNTTIEVFSDNSNQGKIYEGKTVTNNIGVFNFRKGASFAGPYLTTIAIDSDGNSSAFSKATSGHSRVLIFQEGNSLLMSPLRTKRSNELIDNRIKSGNWDGLKTNEYLTILDGIFDVGLKRISLAINGCDWAGINWTVPENYIPPDFDKLITSLADNGTTITYVLSFWDKEYVTQGGEVHYPRLSTEEEIQRYLNFVRFIVHHFGDRIQYFELWNEPDIGSEIREQRIEVDDYINMARQAISVIHQENPEAKIIVGAVIPFSEPPYEIEYLFSILRSDLMPLVDAISWHRCSRESPQYVKEYYYNYPSIVQEIKDVASAHGFKGKYFADELYYEIDWENETPQYPKYTKMIAARYYARSIIMHLGMDVIIGLHTGAISNKGPDTFTIQNLCTIMAGAKAINLPIEIQSDATNLRNYTFSLSNGDKLIALYTDGVAVDVDPGVMVKITIHNITSENVTGIDVLEGFQQPIVAHNENGTLTIQNLIVKDYPLILKISE